jgi:hypothetical protein
MSVAAIRNVKTSSWSWPPSMPGSSADTPAPRGRVRSTPHVFSRTTKRQDKLDRLHLEFSPPTGISTLTFAHRYTMFVANLWPIVIGSSTRSKACRPVGFRSQYPPHSVQKTLLLRTKQKNFSRIYRINCRNCRFPLSKMEIGFIGLIGKGLKMYHLRNPQNIVDTRWGIPP